MAKATKIKVSVQTYVDGVTLELSQEEAQVLMDLVGCCVVGSPYDSRRKFTHEIYTALSSLGFDPTLYSKHDFMGRVEFKETKNG